MKFYFPQMLDWFDQVRSPLVVDLLERWPTLEELQRAKASSLRQFLTRHNCRSQSKIQERLEPIRRASNRFAWAWKLMELKYPVVLAYLGFLNATEMRDRGNPFSSHEEWLKLVRLHSSGICPTDIWDQLIRVNGGILLPLTRSFKQPLNTPLSERALLQRSAFQAILSGI